MKRTVTIICILVTVPLAGWLALERQGVLKLQHENDSLRERLSQIDKVTAENRRLSNLVAGATGASGSERAGDAAGGDASAPRQALPTDEPKNELVRLRAEAQRLHEQAKEIERLHANTSEARASAESALKTKNVQRLAGAESQVASTGNGLELLAANYYTDKTNLDVSDELRDRIRGDSLKAIASNNLKGDPEFGQVKHLTVVYRFGGVTMTNEFQEGDFVVLPKPDGPGQ